MRDMRVRSAVTLAVLAVLLVVMAVVGWQRLTSPLPTETSAPAPVCQVYKTTKKVVRRQVQVSVYNATQRDGLADTTMAGLERRHFVVGAVGNSTEQVRGVQVRSQVADDPRAQLVAEQFTPKATVVRASDLPGPGVNVILGKGFKRLKGKAPTTYVLPTPDRVCVDYATPSADPST